MSVQKRHTNQNITINTFVPQSAIEAFSREAGRVISVSFACSTEIRSRRVISRSRTRPTGKYPSWKMKRMMHWESVPELNALRLLDFDPKVLSFGEQPCEIRYKEAGAMRRHYPDLMVVFADRKELWEVKTQFDAETPDVAARTELMTSCLPSLGYSYRIMLASTLLRQPLLHNALQILSQGRRSIDAHDRESLRRVYKSEGALSWGLACNGIYGIRGRATLSRLVLEGVLEFDPSLPLGPTTGFLPTRGGF